MTTDVTQQPELEHHDLAEAIVDLSAAAQQRRTARRDITESAITVAKAIRRHVRSDDDADVSPGVFYAVNLLVEDGAPAGTKGVPILCRLDDARAEGSDDVDVALELIPGSKARRYYPARANDTGALGDIYYRVATAEDYVTFAKEAPAVIAAFARSVRADADEWTSTARDLTKLSVR